MMLQPMMTISVTARIVTISVKTECEQGFLDWQSSGEYN